MNCLDLIGDISPHVQSMLLATDQVGLDILLTKDNWLRCPDDFFKAVDIEVETTMAIEDAGYGVEPVLSGYLDDREDIESCIHSDQLQQGLYYGFTIHPFETMFTKTKRGADPGLIAKYSQWAMWENYTAEEHC